MAEAEFFAASAGAGLIGSMLLVLRSDPSHDLGGCVALLNHLGHSREGWAGMHEKQLQSRAEVVVARLAVARECEAILWTSTVA